MAAVNYVLSEDQFVCSICLSVFVDPVSTPCGHNFCKSCISSYWDKNSHCTCPFCKEDFNTRPQLKINTLLSHMVSQFPKKPPKQEESSEAPEEPTPDQQIHCDICSGPKLKAVKSCLVCLVSFCDTHLKPHGTVSALRRHRLVEPVSNLESRMCAEHHKPLELFCKTDNIFVCTYCSFSDHKSHNIVPLGEECEERKAEVKKMINERRKKIEQIHTSLELSQKAADKLTAEGPEVFTALGQVLQKNLDDLKEAIQGKLKKVTNQNKDLITELEEQISELNHRSTEMEKPANSEDYVHFLKTFTPLESDPNIKNCSELSICQASFEVEVVRSLLELEKTFNKVLDKTYRADLKAKQKCAVDVTFDPDTAHPNLVMTHGNKQVHYKAARKNAPDNSKNISNLPLVLGQQSFSSGSFYFEVQVTGKTHWALGVARESINRKEEITLSPSFGVWVIFLEDNELSASASPSVNLALRCVPQKIGVFVDYEDGVVSFYDVAAAAPIYFFTGCCFNDKLRPFFSPWNTENWRNKSPMIITAVDS